MSDNDLSSLLPHPGFKNRLAFICNCQGCKSGYCTALPTQPCGKAQSYAPAEKGGGVTVEEAKKLGWEKDKYGWRCPFCTGNTENLMKVFSKGK